MQSSHAPYRSNVWNWLALYGLLLVGMSAPLLSVESKSAPMSPTPHIGIAATTLVLYDGSRNTGTPDRQSMLYQSRPTPPAATQSFADGVTTLTTTQKISDLAGYSDNPLFVPALNRAIGFTLHFTVQLVEENHATSDKNGDGIGDRAGLSVTLLGSDHKGIELGFWPDQVWAQQDGTAEPPPNTNTLFTHAEGAAFDTTADMITYALSIQGDSYILVSGDTTILSGRVRDYSAEGQPYTINNFLFVGDNSGTADGVIKLSAVSLIINGAASATATATLPPTATASATATMTPSTSRVLLPVIQQAK